MVVLKAFLALTCKIYSCDFLSEVKAAFWGLGAAFPEVAEKKDGCMICDFTSFSTVIHSYQDDVMVIMKGCAKEPRSRLERFPPPVGLEPGTVRSVGQRLTH